MNLKKIALKRATEVMDAWDPLTESFVPGSFSARIDLTDRFLSNFNKPTRRRMLFADNEVVFPESRTFRHPGTLDVYLLGVTRQDARGGNPYIGLTICQLVTETPTGGSGLATLTRRAAAGPQNDPGWLVETEVTRAFTDMEFRTSSSEAGTSDLKTENFFAFMPSTVVAQAWDYLLLHGKRYRVIDTFADSGLSALRVDEEPDPRLDFVLHLAGTRTYNNVTHEYEQTPAAYNVTGVMENSNDFALWASDSASYLDVYFEAAHLPLAPPPGESWLEIDGRRREVKSVSSQAGTRQYKLRCV